MSLKWPDKDPDEQLDYSIDWGPALDTDTISSLYGKSTMQMGYYRLGQTAKL
jgi:hypothetical protein